MNEYKLMDIKISPSAVRAQLGKILANEAFARSRRMQRFLEFIIEETLAGRSDQIGEYSIGIAVFDRGADFEPAIDPIVRNDARRLRLKLLEYYRQEHDGPAEQVYIDIPKGGYVPVFRAGCPRAASRQNLPWRVAVLPFEVLFAGTDSTMVGRALSISLTACLTNLDGVVAVAQGFLRDQPIRDAASELNLTHVVHGTILKSNDQCRVIISLIDAPEGAQLWARQFDFESGGMLEAQSEIATYLRGEVTARLGLRHAQPVPLAMAA